MSIYVFTNSKFLTKDPSSSTLMTSANYPNKRTWPTKYLICSIGALLLLIGKPHLCLVTDSVMRRAVLNPRHDSVLIMIQSTWNAPPLRISVVSFVFPLGSLVTADILQIGQLIVYFAMSFGMPLIRPNSTIRWMYFRFWHPNFACM